MKKEITKIIMLLCIIGLSSCKKDLQSQPTIIVPDTPITDYDGNTYQTVKIGNQVWMAENFKSLKNANGQIIPDIYIYDSNTTNSTDYGRLYTWSAAVLAAPTGWHLPTQEEWETLINAFGGKGVAGGAFKETGTAHWQQPNTGATNSSGLSLVAAGFRGGDGVFYDLGLHGSYWGTAQSGQEPYCVYTYNTAANVISEVSPIDKTSGIAFAVRYVKN